jgi:hypothetical protein
MHHDAPGHQDYPTLDLSSPNHQETFPLRGASLLTNHRWDVVWDHPLFLYARFQILFCHQKLCCDRAPSFDFLQVAFGFSAFQHPKLMLRSFEYCYCVGNDSHVFGE